MTDKNEKKGSIHTGHRQRMKERFMVSGFDGMADHEVLEYMLFYVFKQGDTNPVAHRLIDAFGSLNGVLEAEYDDLIKVDGIKENAAMYLKAMLPLFKRYRVSLGKRNLMNNSKNCGDFLLAHYTGQKSEKVVAVLLDTRCKIINIETVCDGEISSASFNLRRLVEVVVKNNAAALIIAHNHPGGIALPSKDDVNATISIKNALSATGEHFLNSRAM